MRSRQVFLSGGALSSTTVKDWYYDRWIKGGSWTPPRRFFWKVPTNWPRLVEHASDLTEGNTRGSWNGFAHHYSATDYNLNRGLSTASSKWLSGAVNVLDCIPPAAFLPQCTSYFGSMGVFNYALPSMYTGDERIIADPSNLSALKASSLKAMLPGIKPQLSLINSVIELKDFKTMPRTLKRISGILRRGNRTLRQILGGGADAYLQKEFNVMPLLSDIAGFQRGLRNTKAQVDKLLELERKPLVRHYVSDIGSPYLMNDYPVANLLPMSQLLGTQDMLPERPIDWGNGWVVGSFTTRRSVKYSVSEFRAQIEYTYYLSQYERENAHILGLADSMGVNLNPAIIWNAIPWTFVVDWVIDVSRWLDQFKVQNLEPVTIIHRYLWSIKIARQIDIWVKPNSGMEWLGRPEVLGASTSEVSYKRVPTGISLSDITTSGVSLKEITLAGALALSRRRRK